MRSALLLLLLLVGVAAMAQAPPATVRLASIFGDHMVLQQGMAVPVWGTAAPGETVTVAIAGQTVTARADAGGKWLARVKRLKAGGPLELKVTAKSGAVTLRDVLVGEVWVCAGQSNMARMVCESANADAETAAAIHPQLRFFTVDPLPSGTPAPEVRGAWTACSPETVGAFSALAYYFGREVQQRMHVPIGLIHASWGGSPAEAWMPRAALEADPAYQPILDYKLNTKDPVDYATARRLRDEYIAANQAWGAKDPAQAGKALGWATPACDATAWPSMTLPCDWSKQEPPLKKMGSVWFRKTIDIPAAWEGKELLLRLGRIVFFDHTYWNGTEIGSTGMENFRCGDVRRRYSVPGALVKAGKAVIAVQVLSRGDWGDYGGITEGTLAVGPREAEEAAALSLAGPWQYQVEFARGEAQALPVPPQPKGNITPWTPGSLYNGTIAPLIPFGIKGVVWYQGEANAPRAYQYRTLFPTLIRSWRQAWGQGTFPFLFMELATVTRPTQEVGVSSWAELREAQRYALALPNTGMALTIDHPDRGEIHPANKQEAGKRLAAVALATVYGQKVPYIAPSYRKMTVEEGKIRLHFTVPNGGLRAADPAQLAGFVIAGEDQQWVPATARLEGETVVVWSDAVPQPAAVRYAWAECPVLSLYDQLGLPVSSFRTDTWPTPTMNVVAGASGLPLEYKKTEK